MWQGPFRGYALDANYSEFDYSGSAIYLWRRCFSPQDQCIADKEYFINWVASAVGADLMSAKDLTLVTEKLAEKISVRKDLVRIDKLRIGGGELTRTKLSRLEIKANTIDGRRDYYLLLKRFSEMFGSVLYVGETGDMRDRLRGHLQPDSPFRSRLREIGISVEDTALFYRPGKGMKKDDRVLLESIFTHLVFAPLTLRAG